MKRNITLFYFNRVFTGLRFMIPIWVTFYLDRMTFQQMGYTEITTFLITVLFELPSGALADLIGRKITMICGYLLTGISFVMISVSGSFEVILFWCVINGLGIALTSGSDIALLYDSMKEIKIEKNFSKVMANGAILGRAALLISSILGAYLFRIREYLPYMFVGFGVISAAISTLFAREPHIDSEKFTIKGYLMKFKEGAKESFRTYYSTLMGAFYIIIFSVGLILMYYYEQPYISWLGFSEEETGWIFAAVALGNITVSFLVDRIEKKFGKNKILFMIALIPGILLLFAIRSRVWGLIVLFGEALIIKTRYQYLDKYMNELIESKHRAAALSTLNMFVSLIYLLFLPLSGLFFDETNVGPVLQILGGALLLVAVPISYLLCRNNK